jgi:hypothetical protein
MDDCKSIRLELTDEVSDHVSAGARWHDLADQRGRSRAGKCGCARPRADRRRHFVNKVLTYETLRNPAGSPIDAAYLHHLSLYAGETVVMLIDGLCEISTIAILSIAPFALLL